MTARFARIPIRAAALHLGAQDFRVLICIAGHADRDGRAHPSQRLIASFTGISRPNVAHSIARLQRAGLLQRHRNKRADGGWDQSAYHILFDDPRVLSTETPAVVFGDNGVLFPDTLGCCFQRHTEQSHRTESQNRLRGAPYADNDSAVAWFEHFWRAYPDRGPHPNPKKPAREKFLAAIKKGVDPAVIICSAEAYTAYAASITDRSKVAQAVTWLVQERYGDEVAPARPATRAGMI